MSAHHKALVRRYYHEVLTGQDVALIDELFSPDFVGRNANGPDSNLAQFRQAVIATHTAFPDLQVTIGDQIAEGDKVVTRWLAEGHHLGPFLGGLAPTGKQVVMTGIHIHRIDHNRIAELWEELNLLGLMQQLQS